MPAHPEFLDAFRVGIHSGALPPGLATTPPDEATLRFAVYRNNVSVSLINALTLRFPVIERLVGTDYFRALARDYADRHRPRSPVLFWWGEGFPDFLSAVPPLAAYPYLPDVARIEVARGQAYHAADADPLPPADLAAAAADAERLFLCLHPSVRVLRSGQPAASIWAAHQPGMPPQSLAGKGPEIALVWRDAQFDVHVAAIGPGDAAMIEAILAGSGLMNAAQRAALAEPHHNPQPMLVRLMQAGAIVQSGKAVT